MVYSLHQKSSTAFSISSFIDIHSKKINIFHGKRTTKTKLLGKDEKTVTGKERH
jgi:hypothetical protein